MVENRFNEVSTDKEGDNDTNSGRESPPVDVVLSYWWTKKCIVPEAVRIKKKTNDTDNCHDDLDDYNHHQWVSLINLLFNREFYTSTLLLNMKKYRAQKWIMERAASFSTRLVSLCLNTSALFVHILHVIQCLSMYSNVPVKVENTRNSKKTYCTKFLWKTF